MKNLHHSRTTARRVALAAAPVLVLCLAHSRAAWSQTPSGGSEQSAAAAPEDPQRASEEKSVEYWISQLGHDHYFRRELASKKLIAAGASAVGPLADAIRSGDLEVVERAAAALVEIAVDSAPNKDGGAFIRLTEIGSQGAGRAASAARGAVQEIRTHRHQQAREALVAAGIFVGEKEFIVSAISQIRMTVEIGDEWNGNPDPLQWLEWLDGVDCARISGPAVTLEVIRQIVEIPGLRSLAIVDGTIEDAMLETISKLERLDNLDLRYVRLTDHQGDLLASVPVRDSLNLMGTSISQEKVDALREKLPGLQIDHRRGAFLGVKCQDGNNECELQTVVANGAAEAAGLISGDVIVQIDDNKIQTFRDLQRVINEHVQGDEVEVHYRRGLKIEQVKVRLGRLEEP